MSEVDAVGRMANGPNTLRSLVSDLNALGVQEGMTVLVHSSLSALGWVCGGAPTVILALEKALTETGTLIMPTHSGDLSDPAKWQHPPVPSSWWDVIREEMPAFDRALTPTRGMGVIAETFRKQRAVVRSNHPQVSFAAWGKHKRQIVQDIKYDFALDEHSPLGRLYALDGHVLLMGVSYASNTSLHLAEYKADYPAKTPIKNGLPVIERRKKGWKEVDDIDYDTDDFDDIGALFERTHDVKIGYVGQAVCRLMKQRTLVDFAVHWMESHR